MPIGFPGGGMFSRSGQQSGLNPLLGLGGGEPQIDADQINQLLQQFGGLQIPSQIRPQGLFENMGGISKRAPALATGLDNALIALGNMGPTGRTAGDNISNVARGVSSIGPTRNAQAAAQIMLPLQMAGEVAKLKAQSGYSDYLSAMGDYYSGRNQTTMQKAELDARSREANAQTRASASIRGHELAAQKEAYIGRNGNVMLPEYNADSDQVEYREHPEIDPKSLHTAKMNAMLGQSLQGMAARLALGPPPENPDSPEARDYGNKLTAFLDNRKAVGPNISAGAADTRQDKSQWVNSQKDVFNKIYSGPGSAAIREKRIDNRAQQLFFADKTLPLDKARERAQQEEQAHQGKLTQLWGQFNLMTPEEQQRRGGIAGYLGSQGYDPNTDTFQSPGANTPTASAPPNNLSPGINAILQRLQKP